MKILICALLLLSVLLGCTLSAEQERKLNLAVSSYLNARNDCRLINYVAFTYPELVSSVRAQGDTIFQNRFNCEKDSILLDDPTLKQIIKKGKTIHVLYDLTKYNESSMMQEDEKFKLVALSDDDGNSWFFLDWNDYVNKTLLPKLERLIKK